MMTLLKKQNEGKHLSNPSGFIHSSVLNARFSEQGTPSWEGKWSA